MSTETPGRRTVLKYLAGAAGAGAAAAVGLSHAGTRPASAQANVVFHDQETTLASGGEVDDVAVSGRIEGEYAVPSETAASASFDVTLEHRGPEDAAVTDTIEVDDVDPGGDAVTVEPRYSLVEETSLSASHFTPGPDERERTDRWDLAVRFAVADDGGTTLCESEAGDAAVVAVRPHPDEGDDGEGDDEGDENEDGDAGEAEGTVSGSFTFEVETN